jgi:two-component system sensor kinase FixL
LNQPLTAIGYFTEACIIELKRDYPNATTAIEYMQQVGEMARQSGLVIRGLQDFTRRQPRNPEPTQLGQLIHKTVEMMQFDIRGSAVSIEFDLPDPDVVVVVDRVQIQQVLVNLIRNALGAMANADGEKSLAISVKMNDVVEVFVRDSGEGIAKDHIDRLFEPYVSSKSDGTGVGLTISSRIIDVHGGKLDAWNNEGAGATFRFTLPIDALPS